jgi:RNA polymerase sigma factor for flagellar operon FliA
LSDSAEQLFLAQLSLIERIAESICRRHACFGPDAEDFASGVKLKLMADDYAVLRKFDGRSKLTTYLTTVIANHFRDFRIRMWGKWRPSATAKRRGTLAIELERLLSRDGHSLDEAVEILRSRHRDAPPREALYELAAELPPKAPRRFEGEEGLEDIADENEHADVRVEERERAETMKRAHTALARAIADLDGEDRLIVKMRFEDGFTVALIARQLAIRQRLLYSRIEKLLKTLRERLEAAGVGVDVLDAVGWEGPAP